MESAEKLDLRQVEQDFSSFIAKFLAYLVILSTFQCFQRALLHFHIEKSSNNTKKLQQMKKFLVRLALNLFLYDISKTRNPCFGDPIRH